MVPRALVEKMGSLYFECLALTKLDLKKVFDEVKK